jgi:hypothetical protein
VQSTIREKRSVGKTVLVVEDNAPVRKMLVAAFLSDGSQSARRQRTVKKQLNWPNKSSPT